MGEYVVKQRLGAGRMGVVYEGEQPVIGRRVAIKFIKPGLDTERGLLEEARAANIVRHRGILEVYGFGELPGLGQYLVMEFLEGKTLEQVLIERVVLRPDEALQIADELLAVLDAAHSRGLLHRDLKPSNLFVVEEAGGGRYVKLLDFGLAKRMSLKGDQAHQTRVSAVVGTPHYMAPEQAQGEPIGPRTDLYAVGVILFELVTGRLPFDGQQPLQIMLKHVNEPPPRPSSFADVPPALEELILQLLEKDATRRPASAAIARQSVKRIARELQSANTRVSTALRPEGSGSRMSASSNPARPNVPSPRANSGPGRPGAGVPRANAESEEVPAAPPKARARNAPSTEEDLPAAARSRSRTAAFAAGAALLLLIAGGALWGLTRTRPEPVSEPVPVPEHRVEQLQPPPVTHEKTDDKPNVIAEKIDAQPPPVRDESTSVKETDAKQHVAPKPPLQKKPAGKGSIRVKGKGWAEVYLDGRQIGIAPLLLGDQPAGSHHLVLKRQQSVISDQTISVRANEETTVEVPAP
ncbi:MAG: protein kinase domain-containing protein [Myxococcaceae bacterium]